eukprot:5600892-Amphidinium_carterae.2
MAARRGAMQRMLGTAIVVISCPYLGTFSVAMILPHSCSVLTDERYAFDKSANLSLSYAVVARYGEASATQRLRILNCHQQTETADFIGALQPVRGRDALLTVPHMIICHRGGWQW